MSGFVRFLVQVFSGSKVNQSNNLSKVILIHASSINAMIPVITVIPSVIKRVQILHFSSRFRCVILVCLVACG